MNVSRTKLACVVLLFLCGSGRAEMPQPAETLQQRDARRTRTLQAVSKLMDDGDVRGAVAELEKLLPDYPNDANLLINLAGGIQQAASEDKDRPDYDAFQKAAGYLRRALKVNPRLARNRYLGSIAGGIYYDAARALAKGGGAADALKVLQEAAAIGLTNVARLEKDEDLESVRALAEFPDFLERARDVLRYRLTPAGVTAISRGSSEATPPVVD